MQRARAHSDCVMVSTRSTPPVKGKILGRLSNNKSTYCRHICNGIASLVQHSTGKEARAYDRECWFIMECSALTKLFERTLAVPEAPPGLPHGAPQRAPLVG